MLGRISRECAERFGDQAAFVDAAKEALTYRQLDARSDAVARTLRVEHGISVGSVVALRMPSDFDYVITYVALSKLGAITAGINPTLATAEQDAICDNLKPDLVITEPVPAASSGGPFEIVDPDPERDCVIVFTSGTTGLPKGAVFKERHLEAIRVIDLGEELIDQWGFGSPMIASTQFPHIGFMTKLVWYLQSGSRIHILSKWRADDFLQVVAEERVSTIGAVAPQLALLLRSPLVSTLDLSCVKQIIAGGAASSPALVKASVEAFDAQYSIRYSSTESGGCGLGTAFGADDEEAFYTVGKPRLGIEFQIVDENQHPVATGEVGELCLRSDAVFHRYWNDPAATAETLVDGWYLTGDLARENESGCVVLCGRRKEMYIRGGYNVSPAEVEAVLCEHPSVRDIAIAPRSDEVMGEVGVAIVVAKDEAVPTLDSLQSFGKERLAKWKLPEAISVVKELPLTNMDKIDRKALAEIAKVVA